MLDQDMTRDEVKEKLSEKSQSINARLHAIESDLPVSPKKIKFLVDHKRLLKRGLVIGAGVVILTLIVRRKTGNIGAYRDGIETVSASIAREIRKNLKSGMDTSDAVSSALEARPPVLELGHGSGAAGSPSILSIFFKQLVVSLGPDLVGLVARKFRSLLPDDSEK